MIYVYALYTLCIVYVLWTPGPHPAFANIDMLYNSYYIVVHSYHLEIHCSLCFIAENQNYLIHGFILKAKKKSFAWIGMQKANKQMQVEIKNLK